MVFEIWDYLWNSIYIHSLFWRKIQFWGKSQIPTIFVSICIPWRKCSYILLLMYIRENYYLCMLVKTYICYYYYAVSGGGASNFTINIHALIKIYLCFAINMHNLVKIYLYFIDNTHTLKKTYPYFPLNMHTLGTTYQYFTINMSSAV